MNAFGRKLRNWVIGGGLAMDAASSLLAAYIWFVRRTGHWTIVNPEIPQKFKETQAPAVFVTWHSRIAMCVYCYPKIKNAKALISENKDGEIIARTIARFGYGSIRGSTKAKHKDKEKGGSRALREMLRSLKKGEIMLVTPDGPRGPAEKVAPGIATLARMSGAAIVPFSYSASRAIEFKSWDRFLLPLPFAKGVFVWGEPITLPDESSAEEQKLFLERIETAICQLTDQANALVGHTSKQKLSRLPDKPADTVNTAHLPVSDDAGTFDKSHLENSR